MFNTLRVFSHILPGCAIGLFVVAVANSSAPAQPPAASITFEQQQQLEEAKQLNSQAVKLSREGKMNESIVFAKQALAIRQKILGDGHPDTAMSMNNLGFLLTVQGDYAAARPYHEQALKIRRSVLGENHTDTANSLNNLGQLIMQQGDYAVARPYYEQSLKINQNTFGNEHPDTARSLNNMGYLLLAQGDYVAGRAYYEQALQIRKRVLGVEHPDTATSLNNMGFLLQTQGDYTAARAYYEQALKIRQKILRPEHPDMAQSLNNLGYLLSAQGDQAAARPYFEQAVMIKKKASGDEHPDVARSLINLGLTFVLQGDFEAARPHFEQALAIFKKVLGDESPDTAAALKNVGFLLKSQGDYAAARPYYEQALKIHKKVLGDDHPETANSLTYLTSFEMAEGNTAAAGRWMEQARRATRQHIARVLPGLSEKDQQLFLKGNNDVTFHHALSLGLIGRQYPEIVILSAGWLLNGKAVGHAALTERALFKRDFKDPKLEGDVQQMLDIRQQLARLTMSTPKAGEELARREKLAKLSAAEEELVRKLTKESGRAAATNPWVELPRVRKALPADGILIDIARFKVFNFQAKGKEEKFQPARYAAWIIPAAGKGEVQIVDLGPADVIEAAVEAARETIQSAAQENSLLRREGEEAGEKQANQGLQKIADLVWKPLAEKLGAAKQVVLSPDGALWLVPWSALPVAENKVLLEIYPLRYVVSGRDVVAPSPTPLGRSKPAIFADPIFDMSDAETRQSIQAMFPSKRMDDPHQTRGMTSQNFLPRVARLPNTATEAQAITPNIERFTKEKPQAYTERYALESVFKTVERPSLLVLSTHGFFLSDQDVKRDDNVLGGLASTDTRAASVTVDGKAIENPLLRCGLLMAGCNSQQSIAGDDGILTGMEIVGVDLRGTDLVVLSACETGVGKIHNGEGVAGLRQAFQLAGAKSVVATLWQVPDRDSMLIMNDFFQNLADGQSKTDALRNAQLKRIQARREKNGAAHPFFWAAWTLTGE